MSKFKGDVAILDRNGKKLSDKDVVATGCKLQVTENGKTGVVASICIKGDVDGNGKLDSMDYVYIRRAFFGTYELKDVYLNAASVGGEANLDVMDYILVKRAYYGTYIFK